MQTESSKLVLQEVDLVTRPLALPSTTGTQALSTTRALSQHDFLMNQILYRIKSDASKTLVIERTRLKTLCSNAYVAIRDNTVIAKANEEKAFGSNYSESN